MKNRLIYLAVGSAMMIATGCESYLDETNYTSVTDKTYITTTVAYEQLVVNAYSDMRGVARLYDLSNYGTDIITRQGKVDGENALNDYINIQTSDGSVIFFWQMAYNAINDCNTAINRSADITDLDATLKAKRNAEMSTLRAYCYFRLVQQFGGVPIVTSETQSASTNYKRATEEATYAFIISELEAAIPNLPAAPDAFGRISQGAAQHLLAKVYLTRGYKSYGSSADFTSAITLADKVIGNGQYELLGSYALVTSSTNQSNKEVIFSVQWSSTTANNSFSYTNSLGATVTVSGNDKHRQCKFMYDSYPGMDRTPDYGRADNRFQPTDYFYSLFSDADAREASVMHRVLYATKAVGTIAKGDTVMYFPKVAWSQAQKSAVKYYVINPDEYRSSTGLTSAQFPLFKKFDDPLAPYDDNLGTRDTYIFRLAETYLIAAEAYVNLGQNDKALPYINAIRTRAAKTGQTAAMQLTADQLTIDKILDEYALELALESDRWEELKRTGKLIERAKLYNPHVAYMNTIKEFNLLRPIPQDEIDLSNNTLTQNPEF